MQACSSYSKISRRHFLGGASTAAAFHALARRGDAQVSSAGVVPRNTAKAVIFVNLTGAPSHVDTFDPKDGPWNPPDADIRQYSGDIRLSRTLFPNLSGLAGDLCVLRSVASWELAHERGQFYMQTAHSSNPAFIAETPHMGAVVAVEKGAVAAMPPFLALNGPPGPGAAFLAGTAAPMTAPSAEGGLTTIQHDFYGPQSQTRFERKWKMLSSLDSALRSAPPSKLMADHADFYAAAKKLMYDASIARVFTFSHDDAARYGGSGFGNACLVARNAVQAHNGTVFINLFTSGWDTHQNMFDRGYHGNMYQLCNGLDAGLAELVKDLKASGDFDSTLIVAMGEFGRTPGALNAQQGRDHHKLAMSVLMMGGGVKGGRAIGVTDSIGYAVKDPGWSANRSIVMEDIAATIYSALGIDWTKSFTDTPSGRSFEYVPGGAIGKYAPVDEVFG